jgi:hypothetical protein
LAKQIGDGAGTLPLAELHELARRQEVIANQLARDC